MASMAKTTKWFRVAFTIGGEVESVQQVQDTGPQGQTIVYVQAKSLRGAKVEAARLRQTLAVRENRRRHHAAGRCHCGRERDNHSFVKCSVCRARAMRDRTRSQNKAKGVPVPALEPKSVAHQDRKREERHAILQEVMDAWQRSSTNGKFSAWLQKALREAGPTEAKAAPKLRVVGKGRVR